MQTLTHETLMPASGDLPRPAGAASVPPQSGSPDAAATMQVRKRNGSLEPVDVNKIVRAVAARCDGLPNVDALKVAVKTIGGLYDGATTSELDTLSIHTAAQLIATSPSTRGWRRAC